MNGDRLVNLVHPARLVGRDQAVRQQAPRAGEAVDQLARLGHLLVGQEPPGRIVERRAAQQRQAGIAVVKDLLHVILELVAGERGDTLLLHLRVPVLARELGQAQELLVVEIVAHEMGLHVEDELPGKPLGARLDDLGLAGLGRVHLEDIAVDLVHGDERRGGRYSPLETIWVGIGVAAEASSAPATRRCSRSLSQVPIGFLRLVEDREGPIDARHPAHATATTRFA